MFESVFILLEEYHKQHFKFNIINSLMLELSGGRLFAQVMPKSVSLSCHFTEKHITKIAQRFYHVQLQKKETGKIFNNFWYQHYQIMK